jgi:predicted nucleic acid-binding protein
MIVTDASVILEVLLGTATAQRIGERIFRPGETLHAPHVLDLEIAQVLRRYVLAGDITPQRGSQALEDLRDLPLTRYPHDILLPRIWQLRNNFTAYDGAYVALAESLGGPLVTRDRALASSSFRLVAKIEVF